VIGVAPSHPQSTVRSWIGTDSDSDVTVVHGVLQGAMSLYLARYLNVPPARIPGEGGERHCHVWTCAR
jgi:hypothetical protein